MAVSATDVIAPMLAAAEVVVFFPAGVAAQTRFGDLFRRFVLERDDLLGIAFFRVCFAWTMARLATRHFVFPTADLDELRVGGMGEGFELIFVTVFTSVTADVVIRLVCCNFAWKDWSRVRRTVGTQPTNGC